ncbi:hypothetical protein C1I97_03600 [Streptomyces sp. NTH33]|uniref:hypothetical protein n=1 Tax=Streptomyces sp. NTH33 TaxID=1735453 RepID=UPI000DAA1CF9|nr:hypothetical protein [Streptomyces sp. NTH33]PZH18676.1 hypothetical protein C1I97_03600 [Streptomyces sp. NTH33]
MSESTTVTDLASQYAAQVAGDLEQNLKEQERISAEIAALQDQLATLQRDHGVLVNMRQALGMTAPPVQPAAGASAAAVPAPRKKAAAKSSTTGRSSGKAGKAGKKPAARKSSAEASAGKAGRPTLVELVRGHLGEQREPRSAAEVATALGRTHPDRPVRATVVRSTLEGLVAKGQAQRTKQGTSVFYTASAAPEQEQAQPEPAGG